MNATTTEMKPGQVWASNRYHWLITDVAESTVAAVLVTKAEGRRWLDGTGYEADREPRTFERENIAAWDLIGS